MYTYVPSTVNISSFLQKNSHKSLKYCIVQFNCHKEHCSSATAVITVSTPVHQGMICSCSYSDQEVQPQGAGEGEGCEIDGGGGVRE